MQSMSMTLRLRGTLDGCWTKAEKACNKSLQALEESGCGGSQPLLPTALFFLPCGAPL